MVSLRWKVILDCKRYLKLILDREAGSYPNDFSQQLISLTILLESEKYKNIYSVLKYQKCLYDF